MDQQPKTRQESKKDPKQKAHPDNNPYSKKYVRYVENNLAVKKGKG